MAENASCSIKTITSKQKVKDTELMQKSLDLTEFFQVPPTHMVGFRTCWVTLNTAIIHSIAIGDVTWRRHLGQRSKVPTNKHWSHQYSS